MNQEWLEVLRPAIARHPIDARRTLWACGVHAVLTNAYPLSWLSSSFGDLLLAETSAAPWRPSYPEAAELAGELLEQGKLLAGDRDWADLAPLIRWAGELAAAGGPPSLEWANCPHRLALPDDALSKMRDMIAAAAAEPGARLCAAAKRRQNSGQLMKGDPASCLQAAADDHRRQVLALAESFARAAHHAHRIELLHVGIDDPHGFDPGTLVLRFIGRRGHDEDMPIMTMALKSVEQLTDPSWVLDRRAREEGESVEQELAWLRARVKKLEGQLAGEDQG